jgi:hypothetical protein
MNPQVFRQSFQPCSACAHQFKKLPAKQSSLRLN